MSSSPVPDPLLPPDHQAAERRRRAHRHQGQLQPSRRRSPASPAHGLHPDRGGVGGRRQRRPGLGHPLPSRRGSCRSRSASSSSSPSGNLKGVRESGKVLRSPPTSSWPTWSCCSRRASAADLGDLPSRPAASRACSPGPTAAPPTASSTGRPFVAARLRVRWRRRDRRREVISNGVPAFCDNAAKRPLDHSPRAPPRAGVRLRCWPRRCTPRPSRRGTPTVISPGGSSCTAPGTLGHVLFYSLQIGTMLILVLAATGFADFPTCQLRRRRQLSSPPAHQRGTACVLQRHHRPSAAAIVLVLVTGARSTASSALRHRRVHQLHAEPGGYGQAPSPAKEPSWRVGCSSTASAAMTPWSRSSLAVTKFTLTSEHRPSSRSSWWCCSG